MKITAVRNFNYKGIKIYNDNLKKNQELKPYDYVTASREIDKMIQQAKTGDIPFEDNEAAEARKKCSDEYSRRINVINTYPSTLFMLILGKKVKRRAIEEAMAIRDKEMARIESMAKKPKTREDIIDEADKKLDEAKEEMLKYDVLSFHKQRRSLKKASEARTTAKEKMSKGDFSAIAGYEKEKQVLDNVFVSEIFKERNGEKANVAGSVLFFGPWNNGKTHISKSVAKEADCRFVEYKSMNNKTLVPDLYELGYQAEEHFQKTGQRTIIFIDELDRYVSTNSPAKVGQGFQAYLHVCSEGLHTTIFAATNNPERLGTSVGGQEVFPIVMSVDIPNDENLKAVLQFYFEDVAKSDVNYDEMLKEIRKTEERFGCKYSVGQVAKIFAEMTKKYNKDSFSQKEIMNFIKSAEVKPDLDNEDVFVFQKQYEMLMGD